MPRDDHQAISTKPPVSRAFDTIEGYATRSSGDDRDDKFVLSSPPPIPHHNPSAEDTPDNDADID